MGFTHLQGLISIVKEITIFHQIFMHSTGLSKYNNKPIRQSWIQTGFQSLLVELEFWIPIVSWILDSLSCILDSKAQDSIFHQHNFPEVGILEANIARILESRFPYVG